MNEFLIHEEDGIVDINLINDESVIKFDSFKTSSAQSAQIQTSIDIDDTLLHDNSTIVEDVSKGGQNMEQQLMVSGVSDDHLEEHQIYSNKKELHKKLHMLALKRKFQFKTTKSMTKLLLVVYLDKV